jgi:hypothetical protein
MVRPTQKRMIPECGWAPGSRWTRGAAVDESEASPERPTALPQLARKAEALEPGSTRQLVDQPGDARDVRSGQSREANQQPLVECPA